MSTTKQLMRHLKEIVHGFARLIVVLFVVTLMVFPTAVL